MLKLRALATKSTAIAHALRVGDVLSTSETLIELINVLALASKQLPPKALNDLQQQLTYMLNAQEREDWLCLADYLEYELVSFINENHL